MTIYKKYPNGLRLVIEKMEGLMSVSCGVIVKTGSANETELDNGISHFIEHVMFKGTKKRSAFEISDYIDRIGAQINAFTSKELTCYYTKSTYEHTVECLEVLSDIFFNSQFLEEELEKEKSVILEEINMSEDTPEDLLFDLLSQSYFGNKGLGQTILGPAQNIKKFTSVCVGDAFHLFPAYTQNLAYNSCRICRIFRLVSISSGIRKRCHIRAVCFKKNTLLRNCPYNLFYLCRRLKGYGTAYSHIIPVIHTFAGNFCTCTTTMQYRLFDFTLISTDNIHSITKGLPYVKHNGGRKLISKLHLLFKPISLYFSGRIVVVII